MNATTDSHDDRRRRLLPTVTSRPPHTNVSSIVSGVGLREPNTYKSCGGLANYFAYGRSVGCRPESDPGSGPCIPTQILGDGHEIGTEARRQKKTGCDICRFSQDLEMSDFEIVWHSTHEVDSCGNHVFCLVRVPKV